MSLNNYIVQYYDNEVMLRQKRAPSEISCVYELDWGIMISFYEKCPDTMAHAE